MIKIKLSAMKRKIIFQGLATQRDKDSYGPDANQ